MESRISFLRAVEMHLNKLLLACSWYPRLVHLSAICDSVINCKYFLAVVHGYAAVIQFNINNN
jgi:hypothetical protein